MANKSSSLTPQIGAQDLNGNGNPPLHNQILLNLSASEQGAILAKSEFVLIPVHTILNEISESIKFSYFVNSGLVSIVTVMSDGKSVEVGLAGKEGFVGLPLLVDFDSSPTRAIVQIEGSAFRMPMQDLKKALQDFPRLEHSLQRYSQELGLQSAHIAACNRLHEVDERLARWLLMSQDRIGSPTFALTQEFIAHMLGTRRASVTVAAGTLQKAGLITYTRGRVTIEKRDELLQASCECYGNMIQQLNKWKNELG